MASSSSLGNASLADASTAQAFYTHFRTATASLLEQLANVSTKEGLQDALSNYAALSAELTRAVDSGVLPAHDRETHKKGLEQVAAVLDERRKKIQAEAQGNKKAGFSFKRNKPSATPKPTTAAATQTDVSTSAHGTTASIAQTVKESSSQPTIETKSISCRSSHLTIASLHNTTHTHTHTHTHTPASASADATSSTLSIHLTNITHSLIDLRSLSRTSAVLSVQLRSVSDSILLLPPIDGSVMIHHLSTSLLVLPLCHQFRMHDSADVVVELSTKRASVATVESCERITFVTGKEAVKVQDFDHLFSSDQLKHQRAQANTNFKLVQIQTEASGLAECASRLATQGVEIKECIKKIVQDIERGGGSA